MDSKQILTNLNNSNDQIQVFRKIITLPPTSFEGWELVASKLEELIKENKINGRDSTLLASQALFSLYAKFDGTNLLTRVKSLLDYQKGKDVEDVAFKLTIAFGYLQLKDKYSLKGLKLEKRMVYLKMFKIILPHCTSYTRHSYFAYKVLYQWLLSTSKIYFWETDEYIYIAKELEGIIFSNWQNSVQDIAKHNSKLFGLYLKTMKCHCNNFLEHILDQCIRHVSWNHIIKYKILTEVISLLPEGFVFNDDAKDYVMTKLLNGILVSHLQKASSNVLELMLKKKLLTSEYVVNVVEKYINEWCDEENDEATYFVIKHILQKVFRMNNEIKEQYILSLNVLYDIYKRTFYNDIKKDKSMLNDNLNIKKVSGMSGLGHFESLRSYLITDSQKAAYISLFPKCTNLPVRFIIKHTISAVLTLANTESQHLRTEMISNLNILFNRIHKDSDMELYSYMLLNLYTLLDHCLAITSTYQRKILGLTIFKNMLHSTNGQLAYCYVYNSKYTIKTDRQAIKCPTICNDENIMRNRLFKLVLDPADDIRTMAKNLLISYFVTKPLHISEVKLLLEKARERGNSLNFYEAEAAAILIQLLYKWKAIDENVEFWILEANKQLINVKQDIYRATCNKEPFYGILIIILKNFLNNELGNEQLINEDSMRQLLNLVEDAVQVFTETLIVPIESSEYASSVAGFGVVIQEIILNCNSECDDLNIKPEHRNIFTCIWRSLKASSEIAAEIAMKSTSNDNIDKACNIILSILLNFYHKGVMKSAGISLGRVCRHFCETNKIVNVKNPFEHQMKTLCELTKSNDEEVGFIIAFHNIVASDVREEKPFLNYAMKTLLAFLLNTEKAMKLGTVMERPLPCVLQLNFLQMLIEDKQLLSSITIYLEDACILCLIYMQAKDFLIRNASLQLFGAIIPRITGQIASASNNFGYGYSLYHFVSHYPQLSKRVLITLKESCALIKERSNDLESYSHLCNILILVSKLFVSGHDLIDFSYDDHMRMYITQVSDYLEECLRCHVAYVRLLAAKALVACTGKRKMISTLVYFARKVITLRNENAVHGYLLAFTYLKEKIQMEIRPFSQQFKSLTLIRFWTRRCSQLAKMERPCFTVETLLLKNPEILYINGYLQTDDMEPLSTDELQSLILPSKFSSHPSFHEFVEELIHQYCLHNDCWSNLDFIEILLTAPIHDYGVAFFKFASHQNDLRGVIENINLVLNSINMRKTGEERLIDSSVKTSLFELLEPEVVKSIAVYKLFDRAWEYGYRKTDKSDTGIQFSKDDIDRLMEESVVIKLFYETLHNFSTIGYSGYTALSDVCRKMYAEFILSGYKFDHGQNLDIYYYILLILRDDVPEVRDIFQHEFESIIYNENDKQSDKLAGFCSKIQYKIINNLKNVSRKEQLLKCQTFMQLIKTSKYEYVSECCSDDISLLSFINHLLVSRFHDKNYLLEYALDCQVLHNVKYFETLKDSINTTDEDYVLHIYNYIFNKCNSFALIK